MLKTNYNFCKRILKVAGISLAISLIVYGIGYFGHAADLRVSADSVADYAAYIQRSSDWFVTCVVVSIGMLGASCFSFLLALLEYFFVKKNIVF